MTKPALFRADGSRHLGLGHVMRCLALAQGFGKIGTNSIFVTKDYEPKVVEVIRRYKYDVELIPKSCSYKEDLLLTLKLANQHNAKLINTDLCHADTLANLDEYGNYLRGLKDTGKLLISIDDLNEMAFPSDIVINPNCGAEGRNYHFVGSTKFLLGPAYFIFRQEFIEAAKASREIKKYARNILITMGGSDLLDLTKKVARALSKLEKTFKLSLRIVLGMDYEEPRKRELSETLQNYGGDYEFIQGSDNLADLMLWSDLAITGAGLTKYESAITGTPSIIIPQVAEQAELAKEFERKGTTLNLGLGTGVSEEGIAEAISRLLRDDTRRTEMSKKGKKLVDGGGIKRIIAEIPKEVMT